MLKLSDIQQLYYLKSLFLKKNRIKSNNIHSNKNIATNILADNHSTYCMQKLDRIKRGTIIEVYNTTRFDWITCVM